jgi:hypothetical protein
MKAALFIMDPRSLNMPMVHQQSHDARHVGQQNFNLILIGDE